MGQACKKPEKQKDDKKERKKKKSSDVDNEGDKKPSEEKKKRKKKKSAEADDGTKQSADDDTSDHSSVSADNAPSHIDPKLEAFIQGRKGAARAPSLTDEEKQSFLKKTAKLVVPAAVVDRVQSEASLKREAKRNKREHATLSAKLDAARQVYELDKSVVRRARAQLAEIERARQLIDDDTSRYERFIQDIFYLTARSSAHSLALRAETLYAKLHTTELERLEEANVDLLAETVVYYDVLPRVYCDARREILRLNQALIGTKKQQLFWHQSKLLHYEGLVEKQERRIDNVIVMARYLQDHASDQGYLLWAERFRKLRDMARYIDSLRFETDDLRSELSYLADLNRVQLEEFGAKRLGSMLQTSNEKLKLLQDALRRHKQRRVNESLVRSACQAIATTVYAPRELPAMQLEFLDSQLEVCVKLAKLFALVSDNQRLRLKTRNAQMLAKVVSLCRKHNTPPAVWRETTARVRSGLAGEGLSSMLGPAWATFTVYDSQVRRAAAAAAAAPASQAPAEPTGPLVPAPPVKQPPPSTLPPAGAGTTVNLLRRIPPTVSFAGMLGMLPSADTQEKAKVAAA